MSSTDGIAGSHRTWHPTTASAPRQVHAASSTTGGDATTHAFGAAFRRNLREIFERGAAGEFDAPGAASFADADRTGVGAAIDHRAQRYEKRIEQSIARLQRLDAKLNAEFQLAALLPSASTGSWDPRTFRPRSAQEAEAFAQRLAIDTTTAAARLDVLKNQLDAAELEAATTGGPRAHQQVAQLTSQLTTQSGYLASLAAIVDHMSGGDVRDAGKEALAGTTLRTAADVSAREIAQELRSRGMSADTVEQMLGASELAIEEADTPQGSARLRQVTREVATYTASKLLLELHEQNAEERARLERQSAERERQQQRLLERKRQEARRSERRLEQRLEQRRLDERRRDERQDEARRVREEQLQAVAARNALEHAAYLQHLAAQAQARRQQVG